MRHLFMLRKPLSPSSFPSSAWERTGAKLCFAEQYPAETTTAKQSFAHCIPKQSLGTRMPQMLAVVLVLLASPAGVRADESDAPPILREVSLRQKLESQAPLDADFRDEQGQSVTLGECISGKTTILVLAYYRCPKLCTQVLNDLASGLTDVMERTSWQLGEQFNVVTVSFDDRETPEMATAKKESYVKEYRLPNMDSGWHFLTGRQQSILRLANAVGFQFRYDPKNDLFAHPACVVILTPEGKVSRYFLGLADKTFARDLRLGLEEASGHKIGTPVADRIVLSCFYYDPETGKYSMTALNLVRAAGAVTMLVLGSALFVIWRREWRKNKPGVPTTGLQQPVAGAPG